MPKQHVVTLSAAEQARLRALLRRDATTALQQRRARILLATNATARPVQTDRAVAAAVGVDVRTVARVRAEFAQHGLERALCGRTPVFPARGKLDSAQEAHLTLLACSAPPPGQARWTLRLLAAHLVELEVVASLSHETVRQTLKKTASSPGQCAAG